MKSSPKAVGYSLVSFFEGYLLHCFLTEQLGDLSFLSSIEAFELGNVHRHRVVFVAFICQSLYKADRSTQHQRQLLYTYVQELRCR